MFEEGKILNKILNLGRGIIPRQIFKRAQPIYHWGLSILGAVVYGLPSRSMKVIAVTGTKGKSTTVYMISKIFEEQGLPVAAVGSLGFKIKEREWPNTLKMTLPGRMKLQKFLHHARQNFVEQNLGGQAKRNPLGYVILEATSEGIVQNRLAGIKIDCAVFTNLHREHLESHGSFEKYIAAKQKLFFKTKNIHVLNIEDPYFEKFANFPAKRKVTYGKEWGDISLKNFQSSTGAKLGAGPVPHRNEVSDAGLSISNYQLRLKLLGNFNLHNALAALAVAFVYGLDMGKAVATLNSIESVPGRMEIIHAPAGLDVVIDYAHTPDSLKLVYQTLRSRLRSKEVQPQWFQEVEPRNSRKPTHRLICVLGAAGGGRDKWKRPEFGRIAAEYCDEVILTNEDPYDENPEVILEQIASGFSKFQKEVQPQKPKEVKPRTPVEPRTPGCKLWKILERKEAIRTALTLAKIGDIVVITGKGSETSMAVTGGRKIPWSDRGIVEELLQK